MRFDAYYKWIGIPPEEQPPNHYRLLAIKLFEADPEVIEAAADRVMAHLRTYQSGQHSALSQQLLNEVSAAKICLLRADKKAAYDDQLRKELSPEPPPDYTPEPAAIPGQLGDFLPSGASHVRKPSHAHPAGRQRFPNTLLIAASVSAAAVVVVGVVFFGHSGGEQPKKQTARVEKKAPPTATPKAKPEQPTPPRPEPKPEPPEPESPKPVPNVATPIPPDPAPSKESPKVETSRSTTNPPAPKPETPKPESKEPAPAHGSVAAALAPSKSTPAPSQSAGTPSSTTDPDLADILGVQDPDSLPPGEVRCVTLSASCCDFALTADCRQVVYADKGKLFLNDVKTGREIVAIPLDAQFLSVAVSPDGHFAAVGTRDKKIRVVDLVARKEMQTIERPELAFVPAFLPGPYLLFAGDDGTRRWDLTTNKLANYFGTQRTGSLAVTPDGTFFLTGSKDKRVRFYNLRSSTQIFQFECESSVRSVAITPDHSRGIAGDESGLLYAWDLVKGKELVRLSIGRNVPIVSSAISRNGRYAISASDRDYRRYL